MNKKVVVIGASGHGKVVADIAQHLDDTIVGFLDDNLKLSKSFLGFPVLGTVDRFTDYIDCQFVIAIGDARIREKIADKLCGIEWYTAIHPSAVISAMGVSIGKGTVIMANAVINAGTRIGRHCIINSAAVVEHDNYIEDYVHVSVGAKLAGTVYIGARTWIGAGAVVSNNLSVCADCMVGAGGVVIKNIEEAGTYVGIPAERIDMKKKNLPGGGVNPSE